MPSQAAILRAARAVPGGARPTPPPQNAGIGMGQISPLAWELAGEAGYSYTYGPFMPRPARTFTQGAFGPFSPILPVPVDEPPPGGELPDPRRFQYPVGWNLPSIPGQDGYRLASFQTLDALSRLYSIARVCIERRKAMVAGLEWDIVPTAEASKAYVGDHEAMRDFAERRNKAVRFFKRPDPDFDDFGDFVSALLEQVFVYDAMSLVLKPKRGKGLRKGLLGSDLDCLGLVDGATIRPLLSLSGGRPKAPAPAYQAFYYGVPRVDISQMWAERDIEDAGLKGYEGPAFSTDQLIYKPVVPRVNSPYGFSATEMALIVIMTGLRKQAYQLQYYDEGTIPGVYISPGDMNITPTQIRELQSALNAYAGDQAWHHKIIVLPPGTHVMPQRAQSLADQFDEILMTEVAMCYDVDPVSLGIVGNVSTEVSPFVAREMAQASRTVHDRTSTKPLLKYLCSVFDTILHRVCRQDDMRFTFSGMDEAQDQQAVTDLLVKQVQNGIRSVDEAREELKLTPWGLPETSGPVVFTQGGVLPFEWVPGAALQQAEGGKGPYSGSIAPSPRPGAVHGDMRPMGVHHPPSSRPWTGSRDLQHIRNGNSPHRTDIPPGSGRAAQTPAHAAAQAHAAMRGKAAPGGGGDRPAPQAVKAELESLARHLRKGRDVGSWEPVHLSGTVMAVIAEDLTKGIAPEDVVRSALTVALPASEYEWLGKAAPAGAPLTAQQRAQQLAAQYTARVQAAFAQVQALAVPLIAGWLAGSLAVTAAALAAMITALLAKVLAAVLRELWAAAWDLGRRMAADLLGAPAGGDREDEAAWADSHGRNWAELIRGTREDDLAEGLQDCARAGMDAEGIASRVGDWLGAGTRAALIAGDQAERALNAAMMTAACKLGVAEKRNITAGDARVCAVCKANAAAGWIAFTAPYPSGALAGPFHPRCRCRPSYRALLPAAGKADGSRRYADLPGQEWWPEGSYPSGPAAGGGAPQHAAHDGDGIEQYVPGGVPGMTAGGEPPRWDGGETPRVVPTGPLPDSAGRGGVQTLGGGTAGGPYEDFSHGTHPHYPEDADDADWPGERGRGGEVPRRWPQQGYMGGYWPSGGHGTAQPPSDSPGGGAPRGRAPNAYGKASAPGLSPRSGMISLDLPEGTIEPVPGGVTDHHVTVVYLGPDVDDEAFAAACARARAAAAAMPGPLAGIICGTGTFPPSPSSGGKVPAWAGVMLPGGDVLRQALQDLSASEHAQWKPHVTLAYLEPGETPPALLAPVPVTFTHLSVHRGGQAERFPLGAPEGA